MILALSSQISQIDKMADEKLGVSISTLMHRAGEAVARTARSMCRLGGRIIILAGKGNNGGDGYAAACSLMGEYEVVVYDVFGVGQKSECGKEFLEKFQNNGGRVEIFAPNDSIIADIKSADLIIDAVFGTGYRGEPPEVIRLLSRIVNESSGAKKLAIDVPMGINADNGSVDTSCAVTVESTVALSLIKPGLVSFPAKAYVGKLIYDNLSLPFDKIFADMTFSYHLVDSSLARAFLPEREDNSSKGTFGKLLCVTGSEKYRGAAHLSLSAALRGGVGYVTFVGCSPLCDALSSTYPEALYLPITPIDNITDGLIGEIVRKSASSGATLLGSGSTVSEGLYRLITALLSAEGGPLVLDADAINVLSEHRDEGLSHIREARRTVILTPHPLEFARLSGSSVSDVQLHRIEAAIKFAAENRCILVLKGAATVTTDGKSVYINSSGSSALAKAGSGDVLAGFLASLVASGASAIECAALAVYLHGAAADVLAREYSAFSVIPSDLPLELGRQIADLVK